jgi:hypothetical protein
VHLVLLVLGVPSLAGFGVCETDYKYTCAYVMSYRMTRRSRLTGNYVCSSQYSGRKITESLGNVTVTGENMERARGEYNGQESEHV